MDLIWKLANSEFLQPLPCLRGESPGIHAGDETSLTQQIDKHVKKRDPNVNWHDVSYFADVSFFDGDFL